MDGTELDLGEEDHLGYVINNLEEFNLKNIPDEEYKIFHEIYKNNWIRIKISPKWNSIAVEAQEKKQVIFGFKWIMKKFPDLVFQHGLELTTIKPRRYLKISTDEIVEFNEKKIMKTL